MITKENEFIPKNANSECIGLFGTCGNSTWRNKFIEHYNKYNVEFFNPQLPDGTWETAPMYYKQQEAWHLNKDKIILFPVTGETYGIRSLGEFGFSIAEALKFDDRRECIFFIDQELDPCLKDNKEMYNLSVSHRALTLEHLRIVAEYDNIHIVNNIYQMRRLSMMLWRQRQEKLDFYKELN